MPICLSHQSALDYYRMCDEVAPHLLDQPRTGKLDGMVTSYAQEALALAMLQFRLPRPVHLLVDSDAHSAGASEVVRHVCAQQLPRRAVIAAEDGFFIASPELVFLQMAPCVSEIDLIMIGYEMCGSYVLDSHDARGFRNRDPLTNTNRLKAFLDGCARQPGLAQAKRALCTLLDDAASPMETAMALLLTAPTRLGGMGFPPPELNRKVATDSGPRKVDLLWSQFKLGLEYMGRPYHSGEAAHERDERRKNAVLASGVEIMNVYYKDLAQQYYFDLLVKSICRVTHVRRRVRRKDFRFLQGILRSKVLPPVRGDGVWMG